MKINIFIIDDHKILIDSFAEHFKNIDDIELVGYALSGCEAIETLNPKTNDKIPDIVLQDIDLKDMSGIDCTKSLMKINPDLKIIGVSSYTEKVIVQKLMKAGAKGYISKSTDIDNLENAIREVYQGKQYLGSYIQESLLSNFDNKPKRKVIVPSISKREQEVLELIAQEMNTNSIAEALFISPNTVLTHRKNLLLKFDVKSSVGLIRKAIEFEMLVD